MEISRFEHQTICLSRQTCHRWHVFVSSSASHFLHSTMMSNDQCHDFELLHYIAIILLLLLLYRNEYIIIFIDKTIVRVVCCPSLMLWIRVVFRTIFLFSPLIMYPDTSRPVFLSIAKLLFQRSEDDGISPFSLFRINVWESILWYTSISSLKQSNLSLFTLRIVQSYGRMRPFGVFELFCRITNVRHKPKN